METNLSLTNIDGDFAALHSYLCADGYVCRNLPHQKTKYYRIGLRNTNLVLLKDFQSKFEKVFGKKPLISRQGDRCQIGNKEIFLWLNKNFGSFHSHDWVLPESFFSYCLLSNWLRAFFDCEAWVVCRKARDRQIALESVNFSELTKIKRCLKRFFAIDSSVCSRSKRSTWRISICGKDGLMKFKNKIGFLHPQKKRKLDETLDSFADYSWHFPKGGLTLRAFVLSFLKKRVKRTGRRIRICSNKKKNLIGLSRAMKALFSIDSKVSKSRFNGVGTRFFELAIQKKESVAQLKKLLG